MNTKKILTIITLILFSVVVTMAQNNDEYNPVAETAFEDAAAAEYNTKVILENNRKIEIAYYGEYEGNNYRPSVKTEEIYDDKGRITTKTVLFFGWNDSKDVWIETSRNEDEYRYNADGKIIFCTEARLYFDEKQNTRNGNKTEKHSDNNAINTSVEYNWSNENKSWVYKNKYEYEETFDTIYISNNTYDIEIMYKGISYEWNSTDNDFVPMYKNISRTIENKISYQSRFKWNKEKSDWIKNQYHETFFDRNGQATASIYYSLDTTSNDWIQYKKTEFLTNKDNPIIREDQDYYWDKKSAEWQKTEEALVPEAWLQIVNSTKLTPKQALSQLFNINEKLIEQKADTLLFAQINYYIADIYYKMKENEKAEQHIRQAIDLYQNDFRFYSLYGCIYFNRKRDFKQALGQFEKTLSVFPQSLYPVGDFYNQDKASINSNLALTNYHLQQYENAAEYFRIAQENGYWMSQTDYNAWTHSLARVAVNKSPAEQDSIYLFALENIFKYINYDDEYTDYNDEYFNYGDEPFDYDNEYFKNNIGRRLFLMYQICLMQRGTEAHKTCEEAITLTKKILQFMDKKDKNRQDYYDYLTMFYTRCSDLNINDNSKELFKQAVKYGKLSMTCSNNSYNLSCVYALKGDTKPAFRYLKKALKKGQITFSYVEFDNDWCKLRTHPEYLKLKKYTNR